MGYFGRELLIVRGVVVGAGKRLDQVGQRLRTLLAGLFTSRDLQESKARLEEAQRVAHVGYWGWNLWNLQTLIHCSPRLKLGSLAIRPIDHAERDLSSSVRALFHADDQQEALDKMKS